jgi:hypothetical protein
MEFVLYLGVFVLFGAVLLWADKATWPVVAAFGGLTAILLVALVWQATRRRTVLLVGEPSDRVDRIGRALEEAGYEVCSCAGPGNRPCPVLLGRDCPISDRPLAALISRSVGDLAPPAPCGPALGVPAVVIQERTQAEPEIVGVFTPTGMERTAGRTIDVLEDLLAA